MKGFGFVFETEDPEASDDAADAKMVVINRHNPVSEVCLGAFLLYDLSCWTILSLLPLQAIKSQHAIKGTSLVALQIFVLSPVEVRLLVNDWGVGENGTLGQRKERLDVIVATLQLPIAPFQYLLHGTPLMVRVLEVVKVHQATHRRSGRYRRRLAAATAHPDDWLRESGGAGNQDPTMLNQTDSAGRLPLAQSS